MSSPSIEVGESIPSPVDTDVESGAPAWEEAGPARLSDEALEQIRRYSRWAIDAFVVAAVVLFVLVQLGPGNLIANTTPAGGDMGAHVWGPAYLRDHLLPSFRLTGWTPDWYDGFPAYQFYMVVPALLIVAVNEGLRGWASFLPMLVASGLILGPLRLQMRREVLAVVATVSAIAVVVATAVFISEGDPWWIPTFVGLLAGGAYLSGSLVASVLGRYHSPRWTRPALVVAGALVAVFGIGFPYGVSFKFVSVAGLLAIPVAAYVFGRLAGLPFPTPALLAASTLIFIFNREPTPSTGNIIGGNFTSTMAGEFSFTLSLAFAIFYLGFLIAGFRTGRYRVPAAIFLALTVLCHLIPGIFAVIATAVAFVVWPGRRRLQWLLPTLPVAGLLTAFWVLPFVGQHQYVNDMGWEKSPPNIEKFGVWEILFNRPHGKSATELNTVRKQIYEQYLVPNGLKAFVVLALVGLVVCLILRVRVGIWLGITTLVLAFGFLVAPESRLWNARLLPFYYLCICLLAVIGIAQLVRAIALLSARDPLQPVFTVNAAAPLVTLAILLVIVGLPLKALGHTDTDGSFSWMFFSNGAEANPAPDWARWNYSGYERKDTYPEYYALVQTMARLGRERGCGRAMWEYDGDRLNGYGTPMAPMLFPFWTDGCIGSMEGLYFEASMTTPFHFINQRELSTACSCAQRNLPYGSTLDLDLGIKHLQLLGVRYYVAVTAGAVAAADNHADLTPVATSGPWHIYEIADSPLVEPLTAEPAVVTDDNSGMAWVYGKSSPHTPDPDHPKAEGPAMKWYLDPTQWNVFLATSGPSEWQRVRSGETPEARPVDRATVSNAKSDNDSVSFDVDHTGVPILVKASYFPNWEVSGAKGPYRVAPNLMVVVPTSNHVRLHYGQAMVDYAGYGLTLVGIVLLVFLARRRPLPMPELKPSGDALLRRFLKPEAIAREDGELSPREDSG